MRLSITAAVLPRRYDERRALMLKPPYVTIVKIRDECAIAIVAEVVSPDDWGMIDVGGVVDRIVNVGRDEDQMLAAMREHGARDALPLRLETGLARAREANPVRCRVDEKVRDDDDRQHAAARHRGESRNKQNHHGFCERIR